MLEQELSTEYPSLERLRNKTFKNVNTPVLLQLSFVPEISKGSF